MIQVTNLTTGVISIGEEEFVILPLATISVPEDRYTALLSEFMALKNASQISIVTSSVVPSYLLTKTRTQITGAGTTYTPVQVFGGIIHRVTTGMVVDHLPTAADLISAM